MRQIRKAGLVLSLLLGLATIGFAYKNPSNPSAREASPSQSIARHIALLRIGKAQQKAAAAYWLGQQRSAAADAVDSLIDLLGNGSEIHPAEYRSSKVLQKLTLGEEAAAALVNIGHPAVEPLIKVLKTSPLPAARKNAAWALGTLHDIGTTTEI